MNFLSLAECCEIVSGATPKTSVADYWDGDVEWATPADLSKLQGAFIEETPRKITNQGLTSCAATVLPAGSVLLSSRAPIGHVAINTKPMATNQGFKSLIPRPDLLDAKYLFHWLRANKTHLQSLGNGATFKELSKATVGRVRLPVPPLEEQRNIAAILDQADALRAKRRQALAHLDDLSRSIFLDMFGDPLANNLGLDRAAVGSVAPVVTGNSPSRADSANFGDEIEWIKSDNLGDTIAARAQEWLSLQGRRKARTAPPGSVLVTCIAGSPASIGKASMVDREVAFNQQINAVLPSSRLDTTFLLAQFKAAPGLVRSKSTGGMKGLVSKSAFQSIEILLPSVGLQREFAVRAERVGCQRTRAQRAAAAADELFASLQHMAFSGRL